jgi:hypothetical protein
MKRGTIMFKKLNSKIDHLDELTDEFLDNLWIKHPIICTGITTLGIVCCCFLFVAAWVL